MATVIATDEGSCRALTLNRPEKRNALNDELIADLKSGLREADADESVRCVVIRGAGKDFCSGADLSSLQKIADASLEDNLEDARSLGELYKLTRSVRQPVIAAVKGRALAGGCGLALACDLIVADPSARFGFPEVKIGFVPAMVTAILRRSLGEKQSFELLTRGYEFGVDDAARVGLVNTIFETEDFDDAVIRYASEYSKLSAPAVQMTKRLLYDIDGLTFEAAIEKGAQINAETRITDACKEGIARFLEKRSS